MVSPSEMNTAFADMVDREYIGGVRWRKLTNVSAPSCRLTVGPEGISIEPFSSRLPRLWRLLGVPTLAAEWSSVEQVELVRGPFSWGRAEGVSFVVNGRRLVFGCDLSLAEEVIQDVDRFGGGATIRRRTKPKLII
jgi:hypothetical protein